MRELALALRSLTKDKSFTIATVLTLALCIGANAALFGVVYSVVFKPLPVPEPLPALEPAAVPVPPPAPPAPPAAPEADKPAMDK